MDSIKNWFKNSRDYYLGVAIYASLPNKKVSVLKKLNRGKTNYNMSVLVSELRKANKATGTQEKKTTKIISTAPVNQEQINTEVTRDNIKQQSAVNEFKGVRIGDLPPELRVRFLKAKNLFFEMIELKFALNDLPPEAQQSSLKIMVAIDKLDEERDLIWKELNHWKTYRKLLPLPVDELNKLTPAKLYQKKRNATSSITKITKRLDKKYEELENEKNKHKQLLIEAAIRKSEETLHKHQVNINKINELL